MAADQTVDAVADSGPPPEADVRSPASRKSIGWIAAAIAIVWAITVVTFLLHVVVVAAVVWLVLAVLFVPFGPRATDRVVAIVVAAAAVIVLVSWVSVFVPVLVHPIVLVGVLGTVPALTYGLGRSTRPRMKATNYVTVAIGFVSALLWGYPTIGASPQQIINVLYFGPDNPPHFGMIREVWKVHGYAIWETGPGALVDIYRTYPEGVHTILAAVGSVITSSDQPPNIDDSLRLYAFMVALVAGFLAFVLAWGIERVVRTALPPVQLKVGIAEIVGAAILIIGPPAFILISSISFVVGNMLIIAAAVWAVTSERTPRKSALGVGLAIVATCAVYPLLVIMVPPIWVTYLWVTRDYWLKRRVKALLVTAVFALASLPMFVQLYLRAVPHGIDSEGVFEPIPIALFVATAAWLACLLVLGRRWLPKPVLTLAWLTSFLTFVFAVLAIEQWIRLGAFQYYGVKMMYAGLLLTTVVLCTATTCALAGWHNQNVDLPPPRKAVRVTSVISACLLIVTSAFAGLLLTTAAESSLPGAKYRIVPGGVYIGGGVTSVYVGELLLQLSSFSTQNGAIGVIQPCSLTDEKWLGFLGVGITNKTGPVLDAMCYPRAIAEFLSTHPDVKVDIYVSTPGDRDGYLKLKKEYHLENMRVIGTSRVGEPFGSAH